jgi:hypothetical protein
VPYRTVAGTRAYRSTTVSVGRKMVGRARPVTLDKIPFRTFDGFVKQHAHDLLSPREQALFDFLFPAFQGTSDSQDAYEQARSDPLWKAVSPLIIMLPGDRRPRRFAGYNFPRQRYF